MDNMAGKTFHRDSFSAAMDIAVCILRSTIGMDKTTYGGACGLPPTSVSPPSILSSAGAPQQHHGFFPQHDASLRSARDLASQYFRRCGGRMGIGAVYLERTARKLLAGAACQGSAAAARLGKEIVEGAEVKHALRKGGGYLEDNTLHLRRAG